MMTVLLLLASLLIGQPPSLFNTYEIFSNGRDLPGRCSADDPAESFRNRTYVFLGVGGLPFGPDRPMEFRDGVSRTWELGKLSFQVSLVDQKTIRMNRTTAVLLRFFGGDVTGTSQFGHVLVCSCRGNRLRVLFEASGDGVLEAAMAGDRELTITHDFWLPNDPHLGPSRLVEERYLWTRTGRFVRIGKTDRRHGSE